MKKLKLTQNKISLIDNNDYARVSQYKWSYHNSGYAVGCKPQILLHRFIMKPKKNQLIDHKNRNKLDNRKINLRFSTSRKNQYNSLCEDGVHWRKDREAWIVRMNIRGKKRYIGYFKNKKEAETARRKASIKYHKEFSPYV